MGYFAGYKFQPPSGRLVIESDRRTGKQAIALPIVNGDVMAEYFCGTIRAAWIECGLFRLWRLLRFPKHFRARCLQESCAGTVSPYCLYHPDYSKPSHIA